MPPVDLPRLPAVAALEGEDDVYVVGGAVRDLLLGREPHELDFVVEGDAIAVARRIGGRVIAHERFGTATVQLRTAPRSTSPALGGSTTRARARCRRSSSAPRWRRTSSGATSRSTRSPSISRTAS
jgi:tRNA nucleotidyltransferase/poly(A) polymerase